jgi:carbamoyltransferase
LGKDVDWAEKLLFSEHHLSHAASAFFPSPFDEALVLTMDGVGEWVTTSLALGHGNKLALLYSAFTYYAGFRVNSGEYKLMGLAPYGQPRFAGLIKERLIDIREDGSFMLDMSYFDYCTGLTMTNARFEALFGGPPRAAESAPGQREMDLAASIQAVTEEVIVKMARAGLKETGQRNLCLAGGVALNCVANGKLLREGLCDGLWIQPAAGDAGGAIGAALAAHHLMLNQPRAPAGKSDKMKGSLLGPSFSHQEIESYLTGAGARFEVLSEPSMIERTAQALAQGHAVGWHQGRMEFGPRSLGGRSILADPRSPDMQRKLNLKVKRRESFRPFAPSVLEEEASEWFEIGCDSPYMMLVAGVAPDKRLPASDAEKDLFGIDKLNVVRSRIPAVTHVDYSARVQTVSKASNPLYWSLIQRFGEITGCPVLVNTSFNVRGEPIVCTPDDSFRCFMGTGLDMLVIGRCMLKKHEQVHIAVDESAYAYELD